MVPPDLQVMSIGVCDGSAKDGILEGGDFRFVQFNFHTAEIVHNIRDLLEGEKNVFLHPHTDVLADDLAELLQDRKSL